MHCMGRMDAVKHKTVGKSVCQSGRAQVRFMDSLVMTVCVLCMRLPAAGSRFMGLWSEGKPTWVQPLAGDKAAGVAEGDAAAGSSEEDAKQLKQALEARDKAVQVRGFMRL